MQVLFLDNSVSRLLECKPNELKVLLAMVKVARHNVVDLQRKGGKVEELTGLGSKSIENGITGLRKAGVIVKTGINKVWFIDPSFFMKGYYGKIFEISRLIEEKKNNFLEVMDRWEEEEAKEKADKRLIDRWEYLREEQKDFSSQVRVVDGYSEVVTPVTDIDASIITIS